MLNSIDKDAEREAIAIARQKRLNGVDTRLKGRLSHREQRSSRSADYYQAEYKLFGNRV